MTRLLFTPGSLPGDSAVDDRHLLQALGEVEIAWLDAQLTCDLLPAATHAEAVAGVAHTVQALCADPAQLHELAAAASSGGNPVIPFVAAVKNQLPAPAARAVHRGLTSQDVMDTALTRLLAGVLATHQELVRSVLGRLRELSDEHRDTVCLARTLTQPALPTTFGLRIAQWAAGILDARAAVPGQGTYAAAGFIQHGGAAGTRAALVEFAGGQAQELQAAFARQLGADTSCPPWHTNRMRVIAWAGYLTQIVAASAKVAGDVLIGTRPEIGELRLGSAGGSSAMPHKQNPTQAVLLHRNGLLAAAAQQVIALAASEALEERSAGAWHAEWPALAELMSLSVSSLTMLQDMLAGLQADPAAMWTQVQAAGPALLSERLATRFADQLTKPDIAQIVAAADPAAALEQQVGPGDYAELFDPAHYLGQAEDIRQQIFSSVD